MKDYLREQVGLTLAAMSGQGLTVIEALEGSVVRAEPSAGRVSEVGIGSGLPTTEGDGATPSTRSSNVVDFREAADWYHGDNPDYQLARLRRIRQYLRDERIWEADRQRWLSLTMAEGIVLGVIQRNFGEDE